jgi:hypothetical protein
MVRRDEAEQSARRLDLRLTIPAAAPYHAVAGELAGKFAEYAGASAAAAHTLARAVEASIAPFAQASPAVSINLEMSARERELVITAHSGSTMKRATCPLPD